MASFELEGRITRVLPVQTGTNNRGGWSKQEFVVEYQDGNFPSSVCFNVWGEDKVRDFSRFREGDTVKVSFAPSSREYNGRWYTDLRAWKITGGGQPVQASQPSFDDVPAGFAPSSGPFQAPARTLDDFSETGSPSDDLPF